MGLLLRILAMILGYKLAGFWGLIAGFILGHWLVKVLKHHLKQPSSQTQAVQQLLFNTSFPLMGYIAKSDGRVSEKEIAATEELMRRMRLSASQRQEAIALFKTGMQSDFDANALLADFNNRYRQAEPGLGDLNHLLLIYVMAIAMADGALAQGAQSRLGNIAEQLGVSRFLFEQMLRMAEAQTQFRGGFYRDNRQQDSATSSNHSPSALAAAYTALGISPDINDADLKKAYRKLMSQYHPDKLAGQGLPEDMIHVATEKAQEIQAAYDVIRKHRGIK